MLSLPVGVSIYVHTRPTDLRKSFDGLCGIVRNVRVAPLRRRCRQCRDRRDGVVPVAGGSFAGVGSASQTLSASLLTAASAA